MQDQTHRQTGCDPPMVTSRYYANQSSVGNQQTRPIRRALLSKVWHCWHPLVGGPSVTNRYVWTSIRLTIVPVYRHHRRRETGEIADNDAHLCFLRELRAGIITEVHKGHEEQILSFDGFLETHMALFSQRRNLFCIHSIIEKAWR